MDNPFLTLDPINKYELFKRLIKDKDKKFLIMIQQIIKKRLSEINNI